MAQHIATELTATATAAQAVDATGARGSRTVLALGSVLAALGAISYMAVVIFFSEDTPREDYANPLGVAGSAVTTVGLLVILYAILHRRVLGSSWAVVAAAAGLFFAAAQTWFFATGVLGVAEHTTDQQFDEIGETAGIFVMTAPKMILGLVGFGALAIRGWRRTTLSRAEVVLYALAALASFFPPFPPGVLVASIGLFVTAKTSKENHERPA